jgi:predicted amidophosphoribosyltransferase
MFESVGIFPRNARRVGRAVLDFVYPPLCAACRAPVSEPHALCPDCWKAIAFLDGPPCATCGLPFELDPGSDTVCGACHADPPPFDKARSAMRYDDARKKTILALKRADRLDLVQPFARWLERTGKPLIEAADIIVPVPLHWTRLWQRRFNRSALLARRLATLSGKGAEPFLLKRSVRPQARVRCRRPRPGGGMCAAHSGSIHGAAWPFAAKPCSSLTMF